MDANVKPDAEVTDEKEQGYRKPGIENKIPSKKITHKSYMQPTISAASKAVAPKKKILGEKNDDSESISSDTVVRKSTGLPWHATTVTDTKGVQPYDPLTNYLSPRPKFLRYNPDRRKEILLRREGEGGDLFDSEGGTDEEDGSSVGGPGSLASSPREGYVNLECEEMDDGDEATEAVEEDSCWRFRRVLKCLILFAALVLSTLYVSSMNSPSPSPAVRIINDGCFRIQSQFVKAVNRFHGTRVDPEESGRKFDGLVESIHDVDEEVHEDVNLGGEGSHDASREVAAAELSVGDGAINVVEHSNVGADEELNEAAYQQDGEDDVGGSGMAEEEKIVRHGSYVNRVEAGNFASVAASSTLLNDKEETASNKTTYQDLVHDFWSNFEEENAVFTEPDGEVCSEVTGDEEVIIDEYEEKENSMIYDKALNFEILNDDVEENLGGIKNNTFRKIVISSGILILMALFLGFQLRRKRSDVKKSSLPSKPCVKSLAAEKCSLEIEKKKDTKHVDTFAKEETEFSIQSRNDVFEEFSRREAPSVELLGEFVFEDVSSRSLRRCSTRDPSMEVEKENRQPVSSERKSRTKTSLLPTHSEPDSSEFSALSSSSYGSFTAEKKIVKIEDSGSGEVKKVITTPVRRSNRFRNRALVSP